jgi:hypothetical protein
MIRVFKIKEKIWVYDGPSAWYFITINKKVSNKIKQIPILKRGWGSVPVNVTIGETSWKTSIFPDKEGVYLLPVKKEIRKKENLSDSSLVKLEIDIIEDFLI